MGKIYYFSKDEKITYLLKTSWPLSLTNPRTGKVLGLISLTDGALSASGICKGVHIIDTQNKKPAGDRIAAWAKASDAATADALSTAFMIMNSESIEKYCRSRTKTWALVIPNSDEGILCFGKCKNVLI